MRRAGLALAVGLLALAPAAHAGLPRSFVGLYDEEPDGLADQARLGVGIVRQPFDWSRVERSPGEFDFDAYDGYVKQAATAGMSVLPILARPPQFRSSRPAGSTSRAMFPPASNAAYAAFVGAAVRRYGPTGTFWRSHPNVPFLPVHAWQVWNEPNIPNFWRSGVNAKEYVALLRAG
jgi:polysaccharide biosynthesis protein PslG